MRRRWRYPCFPGAKKTCERHGEGCRQTNLVLLPADGVEEAADQGKPGGHVFQLETNIIEDAPLLSQAPRHSLCLTKHVVHLDGQQQIKHQSGVSMCHQLNVQLFTAPAKILSNAGARQVKEGA